MLQVLQELLPENIKLSEMGCIIQNNDTECKVVFWPERESPLCWISSDITGFLTVCNTCSEGTCDGWLPGSITVYHWLTLVHSHNKLGPAHPDVNSLLPKWLWIFYVTHKLTNSKREKKQVGEEKQQKRAREAWGEWEEENLRGERHTLIPNIMPINFSSTFRQWATWFCWNFNYGLSWGSSDHGEARPDGREEWTAWKHLFFISNGG